MRPHALALPTLFLLTAALCMVGGVSLGIFMGITHDFSLAPIHGHLNLLGWASLALMGLTLRAWPELAVGWLAVAQYVISAGAAVVFPVGIYLSIRHDAPALVILAAFVWQAGALLFAGRLAGLLLARRRDALPEPMPAE